jgi:hypothetical protein
VIFQIVAFIQRQILVGLLVSEATELHSETQVVITLEKAGFFVANPVQWNSL